MTASLQTTFIINFGLGVFPGQLGNPVGFAATPATAPATWGTWGDGSSTFSGAWPGVYPGSLTVTLISSLSSGASSSSPNIYSFLDFGGSGQQCDIHNLKNVVFVGCRFQSNNNAGGGLSVGGFTATFYCSAVPPVSLQATPPVVAWPSGSANTHVGASDAGRSTYMVPAANCSQYGINVVYSANSGPMIHDHLDLWGWANAVNLATGGTNSINLQDCWIHDSRYDVTFSDHTDGPGYLNGNAPPANFTMNHCVVSAIGNTNCLALQGGSSNFVNYSITHNYFSAPGGGVLFLGNPDGFSSGVMTQTIFTDNIVGTDVAWATLTFGDYTTIFNNTHSGVSGNLWKRNTFFVLPGTTPVSGQIAFTGANSGNFFLPDGTLSATDF